MSADESGKKSMPGKKAPERVQLADFAGRPLTLPDVASAWEKINPPADGEHILLLGLGPGDPQKLPFACTATKAGNTVFWVEEPECLRRLHPGGIDIPGWRMLSPKDALRLQDAQIYFYRPALRLAPDFWGPLLGRFQAQALAPKTCPAAPANAAVWLPGDENMLLHRELAHALKDAGFAPICGVSGHGVDSLSALWGGRIPAFVLSVNLRGLDSEGRIFHALQALGIPVALWLVDNPWHVLSAARLPWWQDAHIFATDESYLPGLAAAGAHRVHHLPLAVAPHMWRPLPDESECRLLAQLPPRFVGRAAFPQRDSFFAAAHVPDHMLARALNLNSLCSRPDQLANFHWWHKLLGVSLWPGFEARCAGLGAELCAQDNRARWLAKALPHGLCITGDELWRRLVPGAEPEPAVDYYGSLPDLYRNAGAILNVTSLLLPHSLSQRHFDVWAAGGLLLSDASPGLSIFPKELAEPITLNSPNDLAPRLESLAREPRRALKLRQAWREHLAGAHTYGHRLAAIREKICV